MENTAIEHIAAIDTYQPLALNCALSIEHLGECVDDALKEVLHKGEKMHNVERIKHLTSENLATNDVSQPMLLEQLAQTVMADEEQFRETVTEKFSINLQTEHALLGVVDINKINETKGKVVIEQIDISDHIQPTVLESITPVGDGQTITIKPTTNDDFYQTSLVDNGSIQQSVSTIKQPVVLEPLTLIQVEQAMILDQIQSTEILHEKFDITQEFEPIMLEKATVENVQLNTENVIVQSDGVLLESHTFNQGNQDMISESTEATEATKEQSVVSQETEPLILEKVSADKHIEEIPIDPSLLSAYPQTLVLESFTRIDENAVMLLESIGNTEFTAEKSIVSQQIEPLLLEEVTVNIETCRVDEISSKESVTSEKLQPLIFKSQTCEKEQHTFVLEPFESRDDVQNAVEKLEEISSNKSPTCNYLQQMIFETMTPIKENKSNIFQQIESKEVTFNNKFLIHEGQVSADEQLPKVVEDIAISQVTVLVLPTPEVEKQSIILEPIETSENASEKSIASQELKPVLSEQVTTDAKIPESIENIEQIEMNEAVSESFKAAVLESRSRVEDKQANVLKPVGGTEAKKEIVLSRETETLLITTDTKIPTEEMYDVQEPGITAQKTSSTVLPSENLKTLSSQPVSASAGSGSIKLDKIHRHEIASYDMNCTSLENAVIVEDISDDVIKLTQDDRIQLQIEDEIQNLELGKIMILYSQSFCCVLTYKKIDIITPHHAQTHHYTTTNIII